MHRAAFQPQTPATLFPFVSSTKDHPVLAGCKGTPSRRRTPFGIQHVAVWLCGCIMVRGGPSNHDTTTQPLRGPVYEICTKL